MIGDDDLAAFFDTDEFAKTATIVAGGSVTVIFDEPYIDALGQGRERSATMTDADAALLTAGTSQLVIDGTTYNVAILKPDGTGITEAKLETASP